MATKANIDKLVGKKEFKPNVKAQGNIISYVQNILTHRKQFVDYFTRLAAIDVAYAAYVAKTTDETNIDGVDVDQVLQEALSRTKDTQIQLVASHVDTVVAHLIEVFLSGNPLFPIVSSADNTKLAQAFESLIQYHGVKSKYIRQFVMSFYDAAKYNIAGIDAFWDSMPSLIPATADVDEDLKLLTEVDESLSMTRLRRVDPYNLIWDYRYAPADVEERGEFVGEVMLMNDVELKTLLNKFSKAGTNLNVNSAQKSDLRSIIKKMDAEGKANPGTAQFVTPNYVEKPQISHMVASTANLNNVGWGQWMGLESNIENSHRSIYTDYAGLYEVVKIYARIIPSQLGLKVPSENTPQVWEFWIVNNAVLIYAQPKLTAHGKLPIKLGQVQEDGLTYQTKSIAERAIPFQHTATDMLAIRINSAKRAINDREFYDPNYVNSTDINNPSPTAKIPVMGLGFGKSIRDIIYSVPYSDTSSGSALVDMREVIQLGNDMAGINRFKQGQTQKGNRSAREFDSVMQYSDLRNRMYALMIEANIMIPIKDTIKFNIVIHRSTLKGFNARTGELIELDPKQIQDALIEFKIADGYSPRAKLAGSEELNLAFTAISQMPQLQGTYDMTKMFAHLMSLSGVIDLDQYAYSQEDINAILAKALPILQKMQQDQAMNEAQPNVQQPKVG